MKKPSKILFYGALILGITLCVYVLRDTLWPRTHPAAQAAEKANGAATAQDGQPTGSAAATSTVSGPSSTVDQPQPAELSYIPPVADYVERIESSLQDVWEAFRDQYPGIDPTDTGAFHTVILDKRAAYGRELDEQEALEYAEWLRQVEAMQAALVRARGAHLGLSINGTNEEDRSFLLTGFSGVKPEYTFTQNAKAAESTGVNLVRFNGAHDPLTGDLVAGTGLYVNVNDHGEIYDENPEFQLPEGGTRVVLVEVPSYTGGDRGHMTHVAGTVGAWGYNASVMGMAPRVWIRSHIQQYQSDIYDYGMRYPGESHPALNPRTGETEMKSVMGTTSLGNDDTNTNKGVYTFASASFDNTLWDVPYYTHFYAAVNDGPSYATLGTNSAVTKNTLIIGSVSDTTRDDDGRYVSGGNVSNFSSRGPTFDGRIKPDLVANGEGLTSPVNATGNGGKSGTSMATPNASGSATLLISYIESRFPGHFFRSSTIKALLVNTATDRGETGPDYRYGWGILNVKGAANIIRDYADQPSRGTVVEDRITAGQQWSRSYTSDGTTPIRVTVAWLDPGGEGQSTSTSDRSPRLVNDLDLRLTTAADGSIWQPYVMPYTTGNGSYSAFDANLYAAPAVTGDNDTDNVEQILVTAPPAGTYTLTISHEGSLNGGVQDFSLVVEGMEAAVAEPMVVTSTTPEIADAVDNLVLTIGGSGFHLGSDVLLRRDGSDTMKAYGIQITGNEIVCRVDAAAMDKGYWDVVVRSPDGRESVLGNALLKKCPMSGLRASLYENDFENGATGLTLEGGWAVSDPDKGAVGGPADPFNGTGSLVTYPGGNYPTGVTVAATLPALSTLNRSEIQVEVQRWAGFIRGPGSRDYGYLQYSLDGSNWVTLVRHENLIESNWTSQTYALPVSIENQPNLHLRFLLESDGKDTSTGWNLDDLRVTAVSAIALPPIIQGSPDRLTVVGEAYSYTFTAEDADTPLADLVTTVNGLPDGLSFVQDGAGGGTISGQTTQSGTARIEITVGDSNYTTHQIIELIVVSPSGNTPPAFSTTSIPPAYVSELYATVIAAEDADGHKLTLSSQWIPPWMTLIDQGDGTALLSGTPTPGSIGSTDVQIEASDGIDSVTLAVPLLVNPPSRVELSAAAVSVPEGNAEVILTVNRVLNAHGSVQVAYQTTAVTASADEDYITESGTLSWADGDDTPRQIVVMLMDDAFTEGNETFRVSLSSLAGMGTLGTALSTVTLLDDENNQPPTATILFPNDSTSIASVDNGLLLAGSISDDGQPYWGLQTVSWEWVSGPAAPTFSSANAPQTDVSFPLPGTYRLRLRASDGEFSDSTDIRIEVGPILEPQAGSGILREVFTGIPGTAVSSLTASAKFINDQPDSIEILDTLVEAPGAAGDNYGQRLRGYFIPDQTGDHVFWIASDDTSQLWLSTSSTPEDKQMIASVNSYTSSRQWDKFPGVQNSAPVSLVAGQPYYLEVLMKEGSGADNLAVGLTLPDGTLERPMSATRMSAYRAATAIQAPNIIQLEAAASGLEAQLAATYTDSANLPSPTSVATAWSIVSGPGNALIADPQQASTSVSFSSPGEYRLRFEAGDGQATVFMEIDCVVTAASGFSSWIGSYPVGDMLLPEQDFDRDGIDNLMEYALGGDPSSPAQSIRPIQAIQSVEAAPHLSLSFTPAHTDLLYSIESSSDGVNWTSTALSGLVAGQPYTHTDSVPLHPGTTRLMILKVVEP